MAHFAKVHNGIVEKIIVAEPEFFDTFIDSSPGDWIQCSYNTRRGIHYEPNSDTPSADQTKALRKNFPAIGFIYDKELDAFYSKQPFPSWTLNQNSCTWEPPVPKPNDPDLKWNETTLSWE